jgi:type I restriction enzyme S subunit
MTELPKGWSYSRLDEVATIIRGVTYSSKDVMPAGSSDAVMLLRATNIQNGVLDLLDPVWILRVLVKPQQMLIVGDIVIASSSGSIQIVGKSASVKSSIDATFGAFCTTVRAKSIEPGYLAHYLQDPTLRQKWSDLAGGSNINNLKTTDIAATPIPVPPIEEQKNIVETLDDHLTRLDKALAELEHADAQMHVLRRSILNELLTNKVSDSGPGARRINEFPSDWATLRLGDVAEVIMGQSPPGSTYNKSGAGVPFFQGKAEFGSKHPTVRQWTTAGTKFAKAGDVLMSVRAPVGPTNIADQDCAIGRGLAAIRAGSQLDQSYLIWYLKHVEASIQSRGKGTTFDAISGNDLRDTPVNLPPLDQQRRIVAVLEDHLSQLDSTRTSIASQRASIHTLRRSLLNKAFSGELGTR